VFSGSTSIILQGRLSGLTQSYFEFIQYVQPPQGRKMVRKVFGADRVRFERATATATLKPFVKDKNSTTNSSVQGEVVKESAVSE
jgi:hypothetical protein